MVETRDLPRLGPYALTRMLDQHPLAQRWLALHEVEQTSHVAYRFPSPLDKAEQRRFLTIAEQLGDIDHPHLLKVEQFTLDAGNAHANIGAGGRAWLICPFTGDADGVRTLGRLIRSKGGALMPDEAEHAIGQVLDACRAAHAAGLHHGPLTLDDVLVARNGSVQLELYGVARALRGLGRGNAELVRDEIRSIVEIGYQLITGLRADEPIIPAHRLVKRLSSRWTNWLGRGLDPSDGFDSAQDAIDALRQMPLRVQVFQRSAVGSR